MTVLLARVALAVGFLSAVGDRLGWWGPHGTPTVAWGDMQHFMPYVAQLNPWFPAALIPLVGWIATIAEIVLGVWLLVGFRLRLAALSSGWLLVAFAAGMTAGPGIKPGVQRLGVCRRGGRLPARGRAAIGGVLMVVG